MLSVNVIRPNYEYRRGARCEDGASPLEHAKTNHLTPSVIGIASRAVRGPVSAISVLGHLVLGHCGGRVSVGFGRIETASLSSAFCVGLWPVRPPDIFV